MKLRHILSTALVCSLMACSTPLELSVPPSTPALLPQIPARIDQDPKPVPRLEDQSMGSLTNAYAELMAEYGLVSINFNLLRRYHECMVETHNTGTTPPQCTAM